MMWFYAVGCTFNFLEVDTLSVFKMRFCKKVHPRMQVGNPVCTLHYTVS